MIRLCRVGDHVVPVVYAWGFPAVDLFSLLTDPSTLLELCLLAAVPPELPQLADLVEPSFASYQRFSVATPLPVTAGDGWTLASYAGNPVWQYDGTPLADQTFGVFCRAANGPNNVLVALELFADPTQWKLRVGANTMGFQFSFYAADLGP